MTADELTELQQLLTVAIVAQRLTPSEEGQRVTTVADLLLAALKGKQTIKKIGTTITNRNDMGEACHQFHVCFENYQKAPACYKGPIFSPK